MTIYEFDLIVKPGCEPRKLWAVAEGLLEAYEQLDLPVSATYRWQAHRIGRGNFDFKPTLAAKE